MKKRNRFCNVVLGMKWMPILLLLSGCAVTGSAEKKKAEPQGDSKEEMLRRAALADVAVNVLQNGAFAEAQQEAMAVLKKDTTNPRARLVTAITRYKAAMRQLSTDVRTIIVGALTTFRPNHKYMRHALETAAKELALVEEDLKQAADTPMVSLELCVACWKVDWNQNGEQDRADEYLFQVEMDQSGKPIPEEDPRRKPTFHFDRGDVYWARALLSFQRAVIHLLQSYKWTEVDRVFQSGPDQVVKIPLDDKTKIQKARELILAGLDHADRARKEYLAEKDDDREWVPNPDQKNHPLPLPVDGQLYETWELTIRDLRTMLEGKEGLSVAEIAQLGDHQWERPPGGFINLGDLLSNPQDIVLDLRKEPDTPAEVESILKDIFAGAYVPEMKPTPMLKRLMRMKGEVDRGEESFERKLKYLIWLN